MCVTVIVQVNSSLGLVIPMFNVPRTDVSLRVEALYLFSECNVSTANIVCLEDIDLQHLQAANRLEMTLVDHNVPAGDQQVLLPSVIEIIDHHKDDTGNVYRSDVAKNIKPVGSCCTLVASDFLEKMPLMLARNPDLVILLLATILVDTVNLDFSAGRTTDSDRDVVTRLTALVDVDQDDLYNRLQNAKFDLSGLSAYDLLRKDFKDATPNSQGIRAGASSVSKMLSNFMKMPDANNALDHFTLDRNLDLLLLVFMSFSSQERQPKRQCAVYSKQGPLRFKVANYLRNQESLQLEEIATNNPNLITFDQGNITISRKQLLPLINDALVDIPLVLAVEQVEIQRVEESVAPFSFDMFSDDDDDDEDDLIAGDQEDHIATRKQPFPLTNGEVTEYLDPDDGSVVSIERIEMQRVEESVVPFSFDLLSDDDSTSSVREPIPELTAEEERRETRLWKTVTIGGKEKVVDMEAIEPYKKVMSHGGKNLVELLG